MLTLVIQTYLSENFDLKSSGICTYVAATKHRPSLTLSREPKNLKELTDNVKILGGSLSLDNVHGTTGAFLIENLLMVSEYCEKCISRTQIPNVLTLYEIYAHLRVLGGVIMELQVEFTTDLARESDGPGKTWLLSLADKIIKQS